MKTTAVPASIPGIHHVTCIAGEVQRNVDFYVGVLGLRFIKQTVNFDVPDTYHLYYADLVGTPGTAMTFFGWPHLPWRPQGSGQITEVAFAIPAGSIQFWADRLRALDVDCRQMERFGSEVLAFKDPDELQLVLVGEASDARFVAWPDGPVDPAHQIRGFHSVALLETDARPTQGFLIATMGFREAGREGSRVRFETGMGGPGALLDVLEDAAAARGEEAVGTVHHVAWRALDDTHELAWREALLAAEVEVTPVIQRKYFRSIYFKEPGGVLFEIATDDPGFAVDETVEALGAALQLPPQYEDRRETLSFNLPALRIPSFPARESAL